MSPQEEPSTLLFSLESSRIRRKHIRCLPLASTSVSVRSAQTTDKNAYHQDISETWDRLAQGSTRIDEGDLKAYAISHGLPTAYLSMFMDMASPGQNEQITRRQFQGFVRSHEHALKRAFKLFDRDGDGKIGLQDLEASLSHVAVSCCQTRCIYRTPRGLAHRLLAQTQVAGETDGREVDFAAFRRFFMLLPRTEMALEFWLRAGAAIDCSDKASQVWEADTAQPVGAWGHLLSGAVAGATSRTATAPLETLRMAVQTGAVQTSNIQRAASEIVQAHGMRGLYRGNGLNVLRSAPQKALDFFAFDGYKRLMRRNCQTDEAPNPVHTFTAAGLAGATSLTLLYPLEVVRSRVTCGAASMPDGLRRVGNLLKGVVAREGPQALY